jgi:hypothetical protein
MIRTAASARIDGMRLRRAGGLGVLVAALLLPVVPVSAQSPSPEAAFSPLPVASAGAQPSGQPGAVASAAPLGGLDPGSPAGRLVAMRDKMESDRLLLAELRKDVPTDRAEAEAYLSQVEDLALSSDPARLGTIVSRVRDAAPAWLDWRAQQYASTQEAAAAYVSSGAAAFDASWGNLHDAILLTVVDRLSTIISLTGQLEGGQ